MSHIDYMKIIDILIKSFGAHKYEMEATHEKIDIFDITIPGDTGKEKNFKFLLSKYQLEILYSNKYLTEDEFERWLSKFEYELEQTFFVNIDLVKEITPINYRILLSY
jgi:CTP:phosphocholine cytidylyltransferase-like protein